MKCPEKLIGFTATPKSRPARGAWIEIMPLTAIALQRRVAPREGRVGEEAID